MLNTINSLQPQTDSRSILDLEKEIKAREKPRVEEPPKTEIASKPATPHFSGPANPWQNLKKQLNSYKTMAPLFSMAYEKAGGDSAKMMEYAQRLSTFHKKTSEIIAKDLWQDEPPAAVLAVIGRTISESMQDIWRGNITNEKLEPRQVADMITGLMPEIDADIDKLFTEENNVPMPALTEASVGVNLFAKLNSTVGSEPQSLQKIYLNKESITSLTQKLIENITTQSKAVSGAIKVHKNIPPQDPFQQDVAYQSTLKTVGRIYEQGLQMAYNQIKNDISIVAGKTNKEKQAYLEKIATNPEGQLYQKTSQIAAEISAVVFRVSKKQETEPGAAENSGPRM